LYVSIPHLSFCIQFCKYEMYVLLQYGNTANVWERICNEHVIKRVPSNLQWNSWTCGWSVTLLPVCQRTDFYIWCFLTYITFVLPYFSFKHKIILMRDAQKPFLEHYSGKSWCYTSKEDEYCVLKKKVHILNLLWIWYISFGKTVFNYMHKPEL